MVNLRVLRELEPVLTEQRENGVEIRRAKADEGEIIAEWVRENINPNWKMACEVAIEQEPSTCFIACAADSCSEINEKSGRLLGFACYDVVKKGVFGPGGVPEAQADSDIGTALFLACLHAMATEGYTEAVIGWSGMSVGHSS